MHKNQSTSELIAAGHAFAKTMSDETPIIEIAKLVSNLATQLDVVSTLLKQCQKSNVAEQLNALAAENVGLKTAMSVTLEHVSVMDTGQAGVAAMIINDALHNSETPATDAWVNGVRAEGGDHA